MGAKSSGSVRFLTHGLCLLLFFLTASCAGTSPAAAPAPKTGPDKGAVSESMLFLSSGEYEASPRLRTHPPRLVAVLPFEGTPEEWDFAPQGLNPMQVLRRGFYNHFSSLPFQDMELREVDKRLQQAGMNDAALLRLAMEHTPERVYDALGVDAVVLGAVTHFDRVYFGLASQASVGCKLRMLDCRTGRELWRAEHVSRGTSGGLSLTPVGWAMDAADSIWNLREEELLNQTDALFRAMVATIERNIPKEIPYGAAAPQVLKSPLQGELRQKAILTAGQSPYLVRGAYRIGPGGELNIEPGVELRFAPGAALRVEGGVLSARGTQDAPVRLLPQTRVQGSYAGVVLENAVDVVFHHVVIEGAVAGLTVEQSAPDILGGELTDCTQAGLVLRSGAEPVLRCVRIVNNQGMGGVLVEGTDVAPRFATCVLENNEPFQVQNYAPVQLDFSNNYWGPQGPGAESALGAIRVRPFLSAPPATEGCHAP